MKRSGNKKDNCFIFTYKDIVSIQLLNIAFRKKEVLYIKKTEH